MRHKPEVFPIGLQNEKPWFGRISVLVASITGAAVLASCGGGDDEAPKDIAFKTVARAEYCCDSFSSSHRYVIARTSSDWRILLLAHYRGDFSRLQLLPNIDFNAETVLAVYIGARSNSCYGVSIEQITEYDSQIEVKYRELKPNSTTCTPAVIDPYHLVSIPATTLPVRFVAL